MGFVDTVRGPLRDVKDFFRSMAEDEFTALGGAAYVAAAGAIAALNASKPTSLDAERRSALRSEFGGRVDDVKITYNAKLYEIVIAGHSVGVNSAAQTFGDHVYVQERYKPGDLGQLELLAHELAHVRQFDKAGSLLGFGIEYFREFYHAGFDYAENNMEEEAERTATCFMIRHGSSIKHAVTWRGEGTWAKDCSLLVPFILDGTPHVLSYEGDGGAIRVDRVKQNGVGIELSREDDWENGWTSIIPFQIGAEAYLLLYKQRTGRSRAVRIRPHAEWSGDRDGWTQAIWDGEWQSGYTHLVPHVIAGRPLCLAYKASTGAVHIYSLTATGAQAIWNGRWEEEWSNFLPFRYAGQPHQLVYKHSNGQVRVDRLSPEGKGVDVLWRGSLSPGWTNFSPLSNTGTRYIAYKGPTDITPGHGTVHVVELAEYQSGGKPRWTTNRWCAMWRKEWNCLVTFPLGNVWHSLVYDRSTGAAHIDRFTE